MIFGRCDSVPADCSFLDLNSARGLRKSKRIQSIFLLILAKISIFFRFLMDFYLLKVDGRLRCCTLLDLNLRAFLLNPKEYSMKPKFHRSGASQKVVLL